MATRGSFIRLGLMQLEAIKDPVVREELEQLVAAIQTWAAKIIPIDNIPVSDIRIDASQIVSGILLRQRGGTGIDTSAGTDGQILIARTGLLPVLATLTAGPGVTITNGPGSITLSANGGGGRWEPLMTGGFGTPTSSELVVSPTGDVVMVWVP